MSKLQAGVWMAQGPSNNVIVKVEGQEPFIRIISGIELNPFFATGKVKALTESSLEIQHILQNPELYDFEQLTVTSAVMDTLGIGSRKFETIGNSFSEDDLKNITDAYRIHLETYGFNLDNQFIIKLCKNFNITVGQASNLLENKVKKLVNLSNF